MVLLELALIIIGFIALIKGADFFVDASSRIAKNLGASEFLIGATLVAIGTSIPELSSSIAAALSGDSGLIIGNVIGSNIANIGLILGISATLASIKVRNLMIRRDAAIMIFTTLAFYLLAIGGKITATEGILFLIIYLAYMTYLFKSKESKEVYDFKGFINHLIKFKYLNHLAQGSYRLLFKKKNKTKKQKTKVEKYLLREISIITIGLLGIIFGARILVDQALYFANTLGIATDIIGITLIAFGTSIPELSVAIRAAKKGYGNMVIGNIIGSNITNILLILGIAALINPVTITGTTAFITAPFMILLSILLLAFMRTDKKIKQKEGIALLLLYTLFIIILLLFT